MTTPRATRIEEAARALLDEEERIRGFAHGKTPAPALWPQLEALRAALAPPVSADPAAVVVVPFPEWAASYGFDVTTAPMEVVYALRAGHAAAHGVGPDGQCTHPAPAPSEGDLAREAFGAKVLDALTRLPGVAWPGPSQPAFFHGTTVDAALSAVMREYDALSRAAGESKETQ